MADPILVEDYVANHNKSLAYLVNLDRRHLAEKYEGAVNNYNTFVQAIGTAPPYPAPTVPIGPGISDPDPDTGLISEVPNAGPVCDPLPLASPIEIGAAPSNIPLIGKRIWPGQPYFQAAQQDSVPGGTRVQGTSSDGVRGTFEKIASPITSGGAVHGVYLLVVAG